MRGFARNRPVAADIPLSLRGAASMPAAALAVHQLRYKLAFGAGASHALAAQGHAYLGSLVPWIVLVAALSIGATLGRFARRCAAGAGGRAGATAGVRVWLAASSALFAVYAAQELLEGLFATGHLGGLAAVFGTGGWWAVPAALVVGGALALALRGARVVERALAAARRCARVVSRGLGELVAPPVSPPNAAIVAPLARAGAERAPPRRLAALV
jgi:voltage-gated potassium channel Kch